MLQSLLISILFILSAVSCVAQEDSKAGSDLLQYEVSRVDTSVVHCVDGKYGEPGFKRWDSVVLYAYVVLPGYPLNFDTLKLVMQLNDLRRRQGWTEVFAFRDKYSVGLFGFSSLYASQQIRKRNGFIGRFNENGMKYGSSLFSSE